VRYNKEGTVVIDEQHTIFQTLTNVSMMNEMVAPPRKHSTIILANEVIELLNINSQLAFTPIFKENTRAALPFLRDYFDVVHNQEGPSIVITRELDGYYTVNVVLRNPLFKQKKIVRRLKIQKINDAVLHLHCPKTAQKIKTINTNIC